MSKKTKAQELQEQLTWSAPHIGKDAPDHKEKAFKYCEGYKQFLNAGKTERECVKEAVHMLKKAGYKPFDRTASYEPGDKVYYVNRRKAIIATTFGKKPLSEGLHINGAHIDSPRLDLKPNPLYEKEDIMIVISNNKRKSINKAKIIVNLDFDNDEFSKYQLNRDAIIINISNNNLDIEKSFNGIFINSLKMCKLKNNYIKNSNLFKLEELYESFIIGEQDFYKAIKKIKEDNVEIQELIGKRGEIQQLEYTKSA